MSQLSFFSAESTPPDAADLAGLLAAQGQPVIVSGRTRISVVVDAAWRAHAVADLIESCGVDAEITTTEEGRPLVRTEPVPELASLAAEWIRGAVKAVPAGWVPGPRALRAWVVAAGRQEAGGARFVLGLDPHAPDTHPVLAQSLMRAGVAPTLVGTHGGSPALRITGRRRVTRLIENIGEPPPGALAAGGWPVLV
ncbi:hypothetical protein HQ325_01130 [Rhodococcus sp. BP-349]|uniref:hypothetical protein n=1 Tax=unclassified Rhodococcus (in: high G+C Gram-positive bacteria) TaxID=192944 RepID=UPI001C9B37E8|nr:MULTISPECIES: hypothetical protein [unclassified Rhodococcus (in: high G+C Gram-positive bacteria)]MBY6537264.1 hypothetical protein [Rhodococcus sp. BP-363]MBY6541601.1 hypothetical protein [Rhodococcus sp. BP-369]MBY6560831.1 hypothetical protein [Rhodococcus sp. BP-370]MBY6575123.1 hypothetical protein [Rhodococcus sp. BP-364]MBY6584424.1 hypothetical protein [Rhodococcus sp. BP-358]